MIEEADMNGFRLPRGMLSSGLVMTDLYLQGYCLMVLSNMLEHDNSSSSTYVAFTKLS